VIFLGWIAKVLRPFGHLAIVDIPTGLDASALATKSVSVHTEMVFSRILHDRAPKRRVSSSLACPLSSRVVA
jgi:NADPH:quinone reductase